MGFNLQGGLGGAAQGAGAGAAGGGWGMAAGALIGGIGGMFGGKKDPYKQQAKAYKKYILPELQKSERTQQGFNNQSLGTYTSSGNNAMNFLEGMGTGNFGLSEVDKNRLAELQGMGDFGGADIGSLEYLQNQGNQAELDSLLNKQSQGGTDLQGMLENHPLFAAMQNIGGNSMDEQFSAAFGGVAPSSFMGEEKGRMGSQNLLSTFDSIQNPLNTVAGLGGQALGQQTGNNTALTQNTMGSLGSIGTGGPQPTGPSMTDQFMGAINPIADKFNPTNMAADDFLMNWFKSKKGGLGGGGNFNPGGFGSDGFQPNRGGGNY